MNFNLFSRNHTLILIVGFAAIVFFTTAYNSHGYYHPDEHYQIIEFAGLKLGTHTPNDLAWEFRAQMRPTLQPVICFVFLKTFDFLNITNPYNQALILRLLSSLLALVFIFHFIQNTKGIIQKESVKVAYYLLSYFLWFIPFISVRFSSETWSGLFFLFSLSLFLNKTRNKPYLIGLLFGVSFLFRFQIAFALFGFGLWLIFINHSKLTYIVKVVLSFCAVVLLGLIVDSWFYGELVFTPWNYFYINIIEGAAAGFGTSPCYYYLYKILSFPTYFIGIPVALSYIILLFKKPKNILLWITIPFIVGHSIVSHKEARFLFPIVYLFPLMLIECYLILNDLGAGFSFKRSLKYYIGIMFVIVNVIGIIAMGQKSAGIGRMQITKYIHDKYGKEKINLISYSYGNPYNPWLGLPNKFYHEDSLTEYRINSLCELNDSLLQDEAINLLVIRKIDKNKIDCCKTLNTNKLIFELQSVPKWIETINDNFRGFENDNLLELYKFTHSNENCK